MDKHFEQLCKDQEIFDGINDSEESIECDKDLEWEMNDPEYGG